MFNFSRSPALVFHFGIGHAFHSKSLRSAKAARCGLSITIGARSAAFVLLLGSFAACHKPTAPTAGTVVQALQNLSELATVQYTITKVVTANDNLTWYKFGERKILITCQATIKAGIDLRAIQPSDVVVSGKSIRIALPPPKILSVNLPPENIKVVWQQIGWLRGGFTAAETNALMVQAEQQMRTAGEALNMPNQAKLNTQSVLTKLLTQLGFTTISLSFDAPPRVG